MPDLASLTSECYKKLIGKDKYDLLTSVKDVQDIYNPQSTSNLLKERLPLLHAQLHPTLNNLLKIKDITIGSNQNLFWICSHPKCDCKEHHIFTSTVYHRAVRHQGCPYCAKFGQKVCKCQCFPNKYPELFKEYDQTKNVSIDPYTLRCNADKVKLDWICKKTTCSCGQHEWSAHLNNRIGNNRGCPYCCNQKICPCNSLATLHPSIAAEFMVAKNEIDPIVISPNSGKSYYWKCPTCQDEWEASPDDRVGRGKVCRACNQESSNESKCREVLKKHNIEFIAQQRFPECKDKKTLPFDFYITKLNLVIENDGKQHFSPSWPFNFEQIRIHDKIKNEYCRSKGVHLLRIAYTQYRNMETIITNFIKEVEQSQKPLIKFVGPQYDKIENFPLPKKINIVLKQKP